MSLGPLASRVFRRNVVKSWVMNAPQQHEPEDLINDVLERREGSLENFRAAVAAREETPYLGPSKSDFVWCSPSDDIEQHHGSPTPGRELLVALGISPWSDQSIIELSYPISVVNALYKPSAVVAGANPLFRYTSVEDEFGRTIGGIREMIHLPVTVIDALVDGTRFREWSI